MLTVAIRYMAPVHIFIRTIDGDIVYKIWPEKAEEGLINSMKCPA